MSVTLEGRTLSTREGTCGTSLWKEGNHIVCHAVGMGRIVAEFSNLLQAPLEDRTGLTAPFVPSLQDAIQEELGLKIEKGKTPVEVLVVELFEKPSEN